MKQRIITAIFALIIFVPFVIYGKWPFQVFIAILAMIGLLELLKMANLIRFKVPSVLAVIYLWLLLFIVNDHIIPVNSYNAVDLTLVFLLVLISYTVLSKNQFTFSHVGIILVATLYVAMGFYFLIYIRIEGLQYILFTLFIIWATDTGAYFCGRALGKRKLWPDISPNKTIEGAIGGLLGAVIVGGLFQLVAPFNQSIIIIIMVALVISISGQIGDLAASAFKRHYNVKDSGKMLPGHGGILDRLDSLLFVLPVLYLIQFI